MHQEEDFDPSDEDAPDAPPRRPRLVSASAIDPKDWQNRIIFDKKGFPKNLLANVMLVLERHPSWSGVLAHDDFAGCPVKLKPAPVSGGDPYPTGEWTETDTIRTAVWIQREVGIECSTESVQNAMLAVAEQHRFHPVRSYLKGLQWDRVERIDSWLSSYLGAAPTDYVRAVGRRWLVSAIARVQEPGCQVDCMLILESKEQGIGKSTALKILAGEDRDWFSDTPVEIGKLDSYQALKRIWIYEMSELAALNGRDAERIKNFVSSRTDHYRQSYGKRFMDFPRQCVFAGTTNHRQYLVDRTGNRRFWPIRCSDAEADIAALRRDRDQLWAEAFHAYLSGSPWHVDTQELRSMCRREQDKRRSQDGWVPIVREWLRSPQAEILCKQKEGLSASDIMIEALKMRPSDINHGNTIRIGVVMVDLNSDKVRVREEGEREYRYFPDFEALRSDLA
ncbi:MAG TPA: virulence-associated E family protein [Polyangiaceae bacterium]